MKKFGFGKKADAAGDEDSNKSALFSSRGKKSAAPTTSSNPYAQQDAPPAYSGGMDQYRQEKSPVPPGGYGNFGSNDRSNDRYGGQGTYGSQGSYGQSRYGGGSPAAGSQGGYGAPPPARQGGYGGFGNEEATEQSRKDLFGGAPQRTQQPPRPSYNSGNSYGSGGYGTTDGAGEENNGTAGGYGGSSQGYGAYGDRELTAEEQEEEDVNAAKQEIKFIKQQDVSSTRNALRLAQQAEETGRGVSETLQRSKDDNKC
jgi:protein transport protein SEC9